MLKGIIFSVLVSSSLWQFVSLGHAQATGCKSFPIWIGEVWTEVSVRISMKGLLFQGIHTWNDARGYFILLSFFPSLFPPGARCGTFFVSFAFSLLVQEDGDSPVRATRIPRDARIALRGLLTASSIQRYWPLRACLSSVVFAFLLSNLGTPPPLWLGLLPFRLAQDASASHRLGLELTSHSLTLWRTTDSFLAHSKPSNYCKGKRTNWREQHNSFIITISPL